jgi:DNA polymerase-3 subunit gamma/tau
MAYLVLARKYRPQTFDEVVGQVHVTQTLNNAIQGGRVAHAILFSGPRGTGKTTIARILAKAMNCESGLTATPCNTCHSCVDITAGRGVDVFEIDGASNNSVDQIRELRDNSRYMPARSRYKIYIIDEVHMLSIAAFNALLKTLEEPPDHVMFLFATTEAHKIPITILSRCQRHDLRRIEAAAIVKHMEALCERESVSISENNLWAIARESGGSIRDALSLLDQVLACGDGHVDDGDVTMLLGGTDRRMLFDLFEAIFARDIGRILAVIDIAYRNGLDLKRFFADVLLHCRHLMLIKMGVRSATLMDLTPGEIETMAEQVQGVSAAFIDQVFTQLFNAETGVKHATQPRLAIEMAFFKIHQISPALPIDLLIERLDRLLKDPRLNATTQGVVEAQSAYGDEEVVLPGDNTADGPEKGDRSKQTRSHADKPSESRPEGLPESDATGGKDDGWRRVVTIIGETKPSIAAALARSQQIAVTPEAFCVAVCDNEYAVNLIRKHLDTIETVCREHTGRGVRIDFSSDAANLSREATAERKANDIRQQLLNHPLVADAIDIFNGKIEEIKIR